MSTRRALEIIRYLATGLLSMGLNVGILVVLTRFAGLHYMVAICICFVAVTVVSFGVNRLWTFNKCGAGAHKDFGRYVLAALLQLPASLLIFNLMVEAGRFTPAVAAVLTAAVFAPVGYLLHRGWSFGLRWVQERG